MQKLVFGGLPLITSIDIRAGSALQSIEELRPRNLFIANIATVSVHDCLSILTSLTARGLPFLSKLSLARLILRLRHQDKDVTPGRIASNFCFNSTQTRSCSSAPAVPLVSPAVGVILQSGKYWPWDSGPTLAPWTSVREPTSVLRAKIFTIRRTAGLSYLR